MTDLEQIVENLNNILREDSSKSPIDIYRMYKVIYTMIARNEDLECRDEFLNNFEALVCEAMIISYKEILDIDYDLDDLLEEIYEEKGRLDLEASKEGC